MAAREGADGTGGGSDNADGSTGAADADAAPYSAFKERLAGWVTVAVVAAFLAVVAYLLLWKTGGNETGWMRRVYLLNGIEAIAFAAVGWLFGREVHRAAAETAEKRAGQAEKRADTASEKAAAEQVSAAEHRVRGEALRDAVLAAAPVADEGAAGPEAAAEGYRVAAVSSPPPPHIAALANLATRLFPT
jgi:hypothetical protein